MAAAVLLASAAPRHAAAQTPIDQEICFTSAIGSCTGFSFWSTPLLDPSSNTPSVVGSTFHLVIQHRNAPDVISGLASFTLSGNAVVTNGQGAISTTSPFPTLSDGTPAVQGGTSAWSSFATFGNQSTPEVPFALTFASDFTPQLSQFIGGCGGGVFDLDHQSPLVTCNDGYLFSVSSNVSEWRVAGVSLDVYAGDGNGDGVPDMASCNASLDGTDGFGQDLGDPFFTASCRVVPQAAVPEPHTWALLLTGMSALAAFRLRRRRARSTVREHHNGRAGRSAVQHMMIAAFGAMLAACQSDSTVAAEASRAVPSPEKPAPVTAPVTVVASPALLAMMDDAETRVIPALDPSLQTPVASAMARVQKALSEGDVARYREALDALHVLVAAPQGMARHDADLDALELLVNAAQRALRDSTTTP